MEMEMETLITQIAHLSFINILSAHSVVVVL